MKSSAWVLIGHGSLLAGCGDVLLGLGHRIAAVVTRDPAIERWASEKRIRVESSEPDLAALLRSLDFDHLASIAYPSIIPADALRAVPGLAINFHDGPLPRLAGRHVTSWAILRREKEHGVTWHALTERADAGAVLEQRLFDVAGDDTAFLLNVRCYAAGLESFAALARRLAAGDTTGREQDLTLRSYFSRFDRPAAAAVIDWQLPAEDISALVRALDFDSRANPLALPKLWLGGDLLAAATSKVSHHSGAAPGTLVAIHQDELQVASATGDVRLGGFTALDGTPVSIADVVRRHGLTRGSTLPLLSAVTAARLTELQGKAARSEDAWRRELATLSFPDVDLPVPSGRARPVSSDRTIDSLLLQRVPPAGRVDAVVAAIAVLASRRSGSAIFDLAYADPGLGLRVEGGLGAFPSALPLRVVLDRDANFAAAVTAIANARAAIHARGPLAADLWGREPLLREIALRGGLSDATVSVGIGVDPPAGRLRFAISTDGAQCRLLATDEFHPLAAQLEAVLESALTSPDQPIARIDLMAPAELAEALQTWNNTERPVRDACIHELFSERARQTPDGIALVFQGRRMTFQELDERTNRLARHLRGLGVGPGVLVGIFLHRSLSMVEAVLGTLKAGGAYVPLDPSYPEDRLAFMVEDAELRLILSEETLLDRVPPGPAEIVSLDAQEGAIVSLSPDPLEQTAGPWDLAYVIYTSGSTGRPKGVMIEHRNVSNFGVGMDDQIDTAGDQNIWLAVTSLSFDMSVLELLWTLSRGFTIVIHRDEDREWFLAAAAHQQLAEVAQLFKQGPAPSAGIPERAEPETIPSLIETHAVTHFQCTPTMAQILFEDPAARAALRRLRQMIVGGEALADDLASELASTVGGIVTNGYGPTETTVFSSTARVPRDGSSVTIGFPIANTTLHVLDKDGRIAPIGLSGELHIGGQGVVRGYWKRPELTAERFVADPFDGGRLYRTGDLVRRRDDGALDFLGRLDHQVKIRGHRIELGEIEARLREHAGVKDVVVAARDDGAGSDLVAYVIPGPGAFDETDLRAHLRARVPDYMMPRAFVRLAAFPMTPNRKIDRNALPSPQRAAVIVAVGPRPEGSLEEAIAAIWCEVMELPAVGVDTSFADLGGDSLAMIQVLGRLKQRVEASVTLVDLFRHTTIRGLARFLTNAGVPAPALEAAASRAASRRAALAHRGRAPAR